MSCSDDRLWRPPNAAATFLQNRTGLGRVASFDAGLDNFVPLVAGESDEAKRLQLIWSDTNKEVEKLFKALEKYQEKLDKDSKGNGTRLDIRRLRWDEAFGQIDKAAKEYENESFNGPKGVVRKSLRSISAHAPIMKHWLNLIPSNSDYASVIGGSFQMFATAASRSYEIRRLVAEIIGEIPILLNQNKKYIDAYKEAPLDSLSRATAQLVKAILITLRLVIEHLTKSSIGRALKAGFLGDDYEKNLQESIEDVRRLAASARDEADVCLHVRIRDMSGKLDDLGALTQNISDKLDQASDISSLATIYYRFLRSNPQLSIDASERKMIEDAGDNTDAADNLEDTKLQKLSSGPTRRQLLRRLKFDIGTPAWDIEECLRLQHTFELGAKDEATYIIQSKNLKRWITTSKSSELLVNGNRIDTAMDDVSPVSLVCAELISLFSLSKSAVVVSYFCGLHATMEDPASEWVPEMMKGLISQLLAQPKNRKLKLDLSFIKDDDIERMREDDLDTLCKVFRKLVEQLPSNMLFFCILDSITRFEVSPEAEKDAIVVLRQLIRLVNRKKKVTMKLLLTSPSDSSFVGGEDMERKVIVGDVLVVPESIDGEMQGIVNMNGVEDSFQIS